MARPAGATSHRGSICSRVLRHTGEIWGNDKIIANMFMGTTTKKSIHKGFALIWLDLTKAGLFTVTQEALGVTCLRSPARGRARRQREPSSILLPSN